MDNLNKDGNVIDKDTESIPIFYIDNSIEQIETTVVLNKKEQ